MTKVTEAHLEARRSQILDAAWDCFAREGYHRTTMQDIATEAGISAGAIYRYYHSKEAVLGAIIQRQTGRYVELLRDIEAEAGGPMDILGYVGQAMLGYLEEPGIEATTRLDIELRPEIIRNQALRDGIRQQLVFWRQSLTQLLTEAKERGELKADVDPETLVILAMCAWEGIRQWGQIDPEMFRPRPVLELVIRLASSVRPAWMGDGEGE